MTTAIATNQKHNARDGYGAPISRRIDATLSNRLKGNYSSGIVTLTTNTVIDVVATLGQAGSSATLMNLDPGTANIGIKFLPQSSTGSLGTYGDPIIIPPGFTLNLDGIWFEFGEITLVHQGTDCSYQLVIV